MALSNMKVDLSLLNSKVARRVFFLFIFCAVLPLTIVASFSFKQVTSQLKEEAEHRLFQANKSAGMSVCERLLLLETKLKIILTIIDGPSIQVSPQTLAKDTDELKTYYSSLALICGNKQVITYLGALKTLPPLTDDEHKHLNTGKTLIKAIPNAEQSARILMFRTVDRPQLGSGLLVGEVNGDYLWGAEYLSSGNEVFAVDEKDQVLYKSFPEQIPAKELKKALHNNSASGRFEWGYREEMYLASYWTIFMLPPFNVQWRIVSSQSTADIFEPVQYFSTIFPLVVILSFLIVLLLSLSQINKSLMPIKILHDATTKIAAKDFKSRVKIQSRDEFEELGTAFNKMADSLDNYFMVMAMINRVGIALSAEKNTDHLLAIILLSAKRITNADGGAIYTKTADQCLKLSAMQFDSIDLSGDVTEGESIPLYDDKGIPNNTTITAYSVLQDKTINIADVYTEQAFNFSGNHDFDQKTGYRSHSILSIPMKNHENEIIGVLQLINARDRGSQTVVPFLEKEQQLAETLASQAAVAMTKNKLVEDFKQLFDSLIELIATAIDEKSANTGGHCKRVPVLTMLLAEAVCNAREGPFTDLCFSEPELYELKVAALLHDCGKVTTPVHVVDKATRLETIFDRIHLIDTRFEVLKRDAHIAVLRNKLAVLSNAGERMPAEVEEQIKNYTQKIETDRTFLRTCNSGEVVMTEELQQKVKEIAHSYTWMNANGAEEYILSEEEIHNLTIPNGTLTPEERAVINYHVVATNKMLEGLPYPRDLRNVPRFAAAHHERMDGHGYPQGLTREQIPLQGRILALADIFEALTAKDRPYKNRKSLMQALRILGIMTQEGHLDPDLFDLFINEKVYQRYAEHYLAPEQIDEVVLSEIPGYASAESRDLTADQAVLATEKTLQEIGITLS